MKTKCSRPLLSTILIASNTVLSHYCRRSMHVSTCTDEWQKIKGTGCCVLSVVFFLPTLFQHFLKCEVIERNGEGCTWRGVQRNRVTVGQIAIFSYCSGLEWIFLRDFLFFFPSPFKKNCKQKGLSLWWYIKKWDGGPFAGYWHNSRFQSNPTMDSRGWGGANDGNRHWLPEPLVTQRPTGVSCLLPHH